MSQKQNHAICDKMCKNEKDLKNEDDLKNEEDLKNEDDLKDDCTLTKHTRRCTYSARDFDIPLCQTPPLRSFFLDTL